MNFTDEQIIVLFMNKKELSVNIKLLHKYAKVPYKTHVTDACYDCIAVSKKEVAPNVFEYGLGFAIEPPEFTQLDFRPRSSVWKTGMVLSNCIGTGDESFTGEYKAVFYHVMTNLPAYEIGDRVCQMQLVSRCNIQFNEVEKLSDSKRGANGFGSTGK